MAPKKGKFATLTAWSYSVYSSYLKCPLSVCFDKIQKIRITEPDNPAFMKGNKSHEIADQFISGTGKASSLKAEIDAPRVQGKPLQKLKIDLTPVKELLTTFRKAKARTELEWAFTRTWTPTGWFDRDVWVRIKTDVCADTLEPPTVDIVDWKTGNHYPEHTQQRSLYALGGLQLVQLGVLAGGSKDTTLTARHVYIDQPNLKATEAFTMKNLAPLKREWEARTKEMLADTTFPAKVGFHCRWCKFRKSAGGPCPENQ